MASAAIPLETDQYGTIGELFQKLHKAPPKVSEVERRLLDSDDSDPTVDAAKVELMKISPAFFAQETLMGPSEAPYYGKFFVGQHHREWDALIREHKRLCVLSPRDSGKSFFFDFAYPIWQSVLANPKETGFIFSATQDQAIRILGDIKDEFENNPKLRHLVPSRKMSNAWSSTRIELTNGSRIYARGFGTKVRGAHPKWIVVDDGLNDETAYSEMVRRKQIDYFYSAITNMVVPGGQIIVVGTPFAVRDLYGDLKLNSEYHWTRYQAFNEKTQLPLWPERYNKKTLEKKRKEIGSIRFSREFMCDPIADDMSLFPGYLFHNDPTEQRTLKLGMPLEFYANLGITPYIGVDLALSSSVKADYTVIWVMGVDGNGNRWIIDIFRDRGLPYQKQLSLINHYGHKYQPALLGVEANQAQRIFGDELIRTTDLPIKKYTTGVEKHSLEKGIPALRVLLENQKFRIPRGDRHSIEMTDLWIDEMRSMTFIDGKIVSVAEHDDMQMGCWLCNNMINMGGFSYSFGDEAQPLSGKGQNMIDEIYGADEETNPDPKGNGGNGTESQASGNLLGDEEAVYGGLTVESVLRQHGIF